MDASQPLPRLWLMTDERIGDRLLDAVAALPARCGIVFRHYRTEARIRRTLFDAVRRARPEGLLLLAGPAEEARAWGAHGSHGRGPGGGLRTAPAHNLHEIRAAEAAGAAAIFLSPVFPTRSHPGAAALGADGFGRLAAQTSLPVIALGGMNASRFAAVRHAYGWAGIDAWLAGEEESPSA